MQKEIKGKQFVFISLMTFHFCYPNIGIYRCIPIITFVHEQAFTNNYFVKMVGIPNILGIYIYFQNISYDLLQRIIESKQIQQLNCDINFGAIIETYHLLWLSNYQNKTKPTRLILNDEMNLQLSNYPLELIKELGVVLFYFYYDSRETFIDWKNVQI